MAPELLAVRLHFESPVHLGSSGSLDSAEIALPSDRLYSVLSLGLSQCWGDGALKEFCDLSVGGTPPFRVSSAFPFVGETYFLPKPRSAPPPDALAEGMGRLLKRLPWLPPEAFSAWLSGAHLEEPALRRAAEALDGEIVAHAHPHVALDRQSAESELFYYAATSFRRDSGLYFLLRIEDEGWRDFLLGALRCIADSGLGARRAAGFGQLRVEWGSAPGGWTGFGAVPTGTTWCLLSRLSPDPTTVGTLLANGTYGVADVGGWISSSGGERRRRVRLFTEGSVFRDWDPGRWVNVTPSGWRGHPVFRGGFAFAAGGVVSA